MRTRLVTLVLVLVAAAASGRAAELPRFEPAPCPMQGAADVAPDVMTCGFLVVPESRERPDGRTLRLAVVRLHSRAAAPAPDPVLYLHGGPGGSATDHWHGWLDDALLDKRDLLLLDQRGVGHSEPVLCPDLGLEDFRILAGDTSAEASLQARAEAALACRDQLARDGFDLAAWNSDASAADVADLRRALGFESWNLFGISYGTKLSLTVLRDHPEGVRSVILDSVYPPGIPGNVRFPELERAFTVLVEGCAGHSACAEAFPDLAASVDQALDALEREPLVIPVDDTDTVPDGRFVINDHDLATSIHQALYDRRIIPLLPLLVRLGGQGDAESLTALVDAFVGRARGINRAVYHTVECYERGPFMLPDEPSQRYPGLQRRMVFFHLDEALCPQWWDVTAGPEEARAVRSDVPTLVMAGEYDPITPPKWGRLAAQTLSNSHYLLFPGVGHAAARGGDCPESILTAFLDDPLGEPDAGCIEDMPRPDFVVDLERRPGVYRMAKALLVEPRAGVRLGLGAIVVALAVGALGWPVGGLVRRRRGAPAAPPAEQRTRQVLAMAAGLGLFFLACLFVMLFLVARSNPYLVGFGIPPSAAALFWLPSLAGILALLGGLALLPAWREMGGRARLAHLVVLAGCVGFLLFCEGFGFF